jgi:hypothetical protein
MVNGSFLVGGPGGQGVLLTRGVDGRWSEPVFLSVGAVSINAQADAKTGPLAMILMTGKAATEFTRGSRFSLNGSVGLTIVHAYAPGMLLAPLAISYCGPTKVCPVSTSAKPKSSRIRRRTWRITAKTSPPGRFWRATSTTRGLKN